MGSWAIPIVIFIHWIILLIILLGAFAAWTRSFESNAFLRRGYTTVIVLVLISYFSTGACVLTTYERYLRKVYAPATVYPEGFISHSLKLFGIHIADITSFWIVTTLLVIGLLGVLYHWKSKPKTA